MDFSWFDDILGEVGNAWNKVSDAAGSAWNTVADYGSKAADWAEQHPNVTAGIGAIAAPMIASALTPKPQQMNMPSVQNTQSQQMAPVSPQTQYADSLSGSSLQLSSQATGAPVQTAIPERTSTNKRKPTTMVAPGSVAYL